MADQRPRGIDFAGIDFGPVAARQPAARGHEGGTAQVADVGDLLAGRQTMRQLDDGPFGAAEDQQIGFRIRQHGAAHLVRPVIVVRDAAQAGFDRADHHVGARKSLATALRVDDDRVIRAPVRLGVGRVGVVGTRLAIGGVAIDHRIHVPGSNAEKQIRPAEYLESLGRQPVGLADDADAKALRFEQAPDQRHAEARVVDVGVAGDQNDVAGVPAEFIHFRPRHRQEGRAAETAGPEFSGRRRDCGVRCAWCRC
jgi:hypothetical protein